MKLSHESSRGTHGEAANDGFEVPGRFAVSATFAPIPAPGIRPGSLLGSRVPSDSLKGFLKDSVPGIHFRALVPRDAKRDMIANLKAVKGRASLARSLAQLAGFF